MSNKTYIDGADTGSTPATADTLQSLQGDTESTVQSTANADPLATLQAKLQQLQAKLHKEFRWYCDTILQGGALAVRVSYKVHCAVEIIEIVDCGEIDTEETRTDSGEIDAGEPTVNIGGSLYTEEDIDRLLETEYLLDELYDTWCFTVHCSTEWSDCMSRLLDTLERDN